MWEYIISVQFDRWKKYVAVAVLLFVHFIIFGSISEIGIEHTLEELLVIHFSSRMFLLFLLPISYSILISNLFCHELNNNQLPLILSRGKNRVEYFLYHIMLLIIVAILLTLYCYLLVFIRAFLLGIPLTISLATVVNQYALLFCLLFFLGLLLFTISIICKNNILGNIVLLIMVLCALAKYNGVNPTSFNPIMRGGLLFHQPYYGEQMSMFIPHSILYFFILLVTVLALGWFAIIKTPLIGKRE